MTAAKIRLEILITEREAMLAANAAREAQGLSPAYGESAFRNLIGEMAQLEVDVRNALWARISSEGD